MNNATTKHASQSVTASQPSAMTLWRAWLQHHRTVAIDSFAGLRRAPFTSIVTCLVIGIALALPSAFYVGINNMQSAFGASNTGARLSLFLYDTVSQEEGQALAAELLAWEHTHKVDYISREKALEEFTMLSGFGDVVDSLPDNPLPAVLVVSLEDDAVNASTADGVRQRADALPQVEDAQLDMAWLQRLQSMMALAARLAWVVGVLLCIGVLLVIGNTIRLAIQQRQDEILVTKLVGGTDAFIRRPFLYTGLWYGIGGACLGWLFVSVAILFVWPPVASLVDQYGASFRLSGLGWRDSLVLLFIGVTMGLGGSWIAVSRHIKLFEPH